MHNLFPMKKRTFHFSGKPVNYYFDASFDVLNKLVPVESAVLITDENVFEAHKKKFKGWSTIVLKPGEQYKVQQTVDVIIDQLIELGADRQTTLIGVGGGVITDITGYVASIYMRGIAVGFVPTSLLAMVDASIGGKNGIDVGVYKNMVGIIRQPNFLLYDTSFLKSLPLSEWQNGFAEIIKHANPTRDFSNVALRIKSLKPDLVIMSNYQNEYVLLARTLHQQRVDVAGMFSVLGGGFNFKLVSEQPDIAQNMMDFNHWYNPRNPKALAMRKAVEAKGGLFTFEVYCGYNSVKCYADALERAKSADKEKVIAALEASTWSDHFMPYGPTKFVDGQNTGGRAAMLQATKTDINVVWPNEFSAVKPVFPRPKFS